MVVTRRTPVVPAPPVSRTPSSQGQPRSARAPVIQDPSVVPRVSSPLASGDAHTAAIITGTSNNFKEYNDKVSSYNEFSDGQIEIYGDLSRLLLGAVLLSACRLPSLL